MAVTAVVSLNPSTITVGGTAFGKVTVSNSDANTRQVVSVSVYPTGSTGNNGQMPVTVVQDPMPPRGGGAGGTNAPEQGITYALPTSGSVVVPFQLTAHQPQVPGASNLTYTINAGVTYWNGTANTNITATTATLTVRPPSTVAM